MYRHHHPHQQSHLRFILIGDYEVGKTALLNSILPPQHPGVLTGSNFRSKTLALCGKDLKVQLWDTEEEERFNASPNYYFEKVDGVFLVYDITRRASFDSVVQFWRAEVEQQAGMGIQMALIGNKCDLHHSREVSKLQAALFADEHGMMFLETSASHPGENLTELLGLLAERVMVQMEDSEGKLEKMNKISLKTSAMKGKHTKPSCF